VQKPFKLTPFAFTFRRHDSIDLWGDLAELA